MSYKIMRLAVFFDLPTSTKKERHLAGKFRKFLLDDGFDMLQYSVYTRICVNRDAADKHMMRICKNAPETGSIRLLYLTEHQFTTMKIIVGEKTNQEKLIKSSQLSFF